MAYNVEKLTKLGALKALAEQMKADYATKASVQELSGKVDELVTTGGEPNVITSVKVNGTAQAVAADKSINITVPTKASQLTNDKNYQTNTEVAAAIQTAIAATGHAKFEKVDTVPTAANAQENVLYLVMNTTTSHYDIYAKVGDSVELLDDTTVDLSGYATKTDLNGKVDKVSGKGLSTNDYTTTEKEKLAGIAEGANKYTHPAYTAKSSGLYKITVDATGHVSAVTPVKKADITALGIPGQDTTYPIATDTEVTEMLTEVFGA